MDIQDADQKRQESTTDAGPEVSVFLRKAVGTWSTSVPLHVPVMGSPSDSPVSIFSVMPLIYASCRISRRSR